MKIINLTKNMFSLVSDEDYDLVNSFRWQSVLRDKRYYAIRTVRIRGSESKVHISMHRFLMNVTDRNIQVDHINGNSLDNRRENLRLCTQSQNNANKDKNSNNTSGYKGVFKSGNKNRWRAQIIFHGKSIHLGVFEDKIDAAKAYDKAAINYFGEFARPNKLTK